MNELLTREPRFRYALLDRMRQDCIYYLHNNRYAKDLWANSPEKQIEYMKAIWESLDEKPEWLTMEQIVELEKQMICK